MYQNNILKKIFNKELQRNKKKYLKFLPVAKLRGFWIECS